MRTTRLVLATLITAATAAAGCNGGTPSGTTSPAAGAASARPAANPGGGTTGGGTSNGGTTGGSTAGGGSGGGTITAGPTASSFVADPAVKAAEKIWHIDFDSFGTQFFDNMVGHGLAVQSLGAAAPINQAVRDKVIGVVLQRVNTAYLRNPNGTKRAGVSFEITFVAVVPQGSAQFAGGPGVGYSRICLGSRDSNCASGTLGVETLDYGNQGVESACVLNQLGTFVGRICGLKSELKGQFSQAPITAADQKYVDGSYRLGQGSAAEDDRFKAINDVIVDWGTSIGNVVAHEIGHSVGLDHDNSGSNIMIAVTNPTDLSNANLQFTARSQAVLKQNLGIEP
jgi:hypothetical protein